MKVTRGSLRSGRALSGLIANVRIALVCVGLSAAHTYAATGPNVEEARDSLMFLTIERTEPSGKITKDSGTGFVITTDGYVLTTAHLLSDGVETNLGDIRVFGKLRSRNSADVPIPLETIKVGCCDLVLLKIPDQGIRYKPLRLGDELRLDGMRLNDPLTVIGFGLQNDLAPANGTLGNKGGNFINGHSDGLWLFNAPANYGNSGGPVMDSFGTVVGIVKGGIPGSQNSNYFVPITSATSLTSALRNTAREPPEATPSSMTDWASSIQRARDDALALGRLGRKAYLDGEMNWTVTILERAAQSRNTISDQFMPFLAAALFRLGRESEGQQRLDWIVVHGPLQQRKPLLMFLRDNLVVARNSSDQAHRPQFDEALKSVKQQLLDFQD